MEECWIEIELKGKPGKKNLVIRRVLDREAEKSKFYIDGEATSAKIVGERMEHLSVQVGNLWYESSNTFLKQFALTLATHRSTFLPQDRVASFAMMSHAELLRETEKAAGDVNLSSWHQILIDEYKAQKEKQIVRPAFHLASGCL